MDAARCPRAQAWTQLTGITSDAGFCLDPVREGDLCDSNAVDARRDPRSVFGGGCAPCEPGTVCAPTGDGERRCVRLCERDGAPEASLCACQGQRCEDRGELFDPETGERIGRFFCSECIVNLNRTCATDDQCCDPQATCVRYTDARVGGERQHCCRAQGVGCDPAARSQCCGDAYCDPDTRVCTPCARLGESVGNTPCCPGLEAVVLAAGQAPVCQSCGLLDDDLLCSPEFLVIRGNDGVESVPIPNTNRGFRHVLGHVGGDLDVTRRDVQQVAYDLTVDHRAFFFDQRLSEGISAGRRYFSLPFNDPPGTPRSARPSDPGPWRSVRVYDSGACSMLLTWEDLAGIVGTEVNKALLSDAGLLADASLTVRRLDFVEITPVLRATPRFPLPFPLGPEDADDRLKIRIRAQIDPLLLSCGIFTLDADVGIRAEPAIAPSSPRDADFASVGCMLSSAVAAPDYDCRLPVQHDDGSWTVERVTLPRLRYDQRAVDDCTTTCVDDRCGSLSGPAYLDCEQVCRAECIDRGPIDFPLDSLTLRVNDDRFAAAHCYPARDQYRCVNIPDLRRAADGEEGLYLFNIPRRRDLWVPRPVTTIDGSTDIAMRVREVRLDIDGPRRECRFQDAIAETYAADVEEALWGFAGQINAVVGSLIPGVQPRRVAVRPDGFELILAEDRYDPQYALVAGVPLLGAALCAPGDDARRAGPEVFSGGPDFVRTLSSHRRDFDATYCAPDALDCRGICAELGAPCGGNAYGRLTGLPIGAPPSAATCHLGECCVPAHFCDGRCRDVRTDPQHCGRCGVRCPADRPMCIDGSCSP